MKNFFRMSRLEYELIIKLMLCAVISMLFSWSIGDLYSPTAAITAVLFLYCDRGYKGSLRYGSRRILVQIIQGLLALTIIFPCKYFDIPIPDIVLIIISSCLALCIGLPINYKKTFSPLNCTLANATLIITCSTVQDLNTFPKRVIECIAGFVIGYFINYIIFSYKDRANEIQHRVKECVYELIYNADHDIYNKNISLIEKDLDFLTEDRTKLNKKMSVSQEEIAYLQMHKKLLNILNDYIALYENHKNELDDKFNEIVQLFFHQVSAIHLSLISQFYESISDEKTIKLSVSAMHNPIELCIVGRLMEYAEFLKYVTCYHRQISRESIKPQAIRRNA